MIIIIIIKTLFMLNSAELEIYTALTLKGTATLIISTSYKKELFKPWILIAVSSKSGEKWRSYGRLKIQYGRH